MGLIGKTIHISADLVILSAFLAGVKRNTGLTPNLGYFNNENVSYYGGKYLGLGEKIFDYSAASFSSSEYFIRK